MGPEMCWGGGVSTCGYHWDHCCGTLPSWSSPRNSHALLWRHNGCDGVSNRQPHHCLLNRSYRHRSKQTSKLRVTGLCAGNSPVTGDFLAQMATGAENVSIWWRHHGRWGTSIWNLRQLYSSLTWNLLLPNNQILCDISNNRQVDCLFNRLSRLTETAKLCITGLWIHRSPMDSFHKGPIKRRSFPCHGVIMLYWPHDDLDRVMPSDHMLSLSLSETPIVTARVLKISFVNYSISKIRLGAQFAHVMHSVLKG